MSQTDAPMTATGDVAAGRRDSGRRLVEKLRRGDDAAAEELVEHYAPRAYRLASAMTRNADAAEEIVRNALWSVVQNADTFDDDAALGLSFYRVVTNAACRRARRTAHQEFEPSFHTDGARAAVVDDWSGRLNDRAIASRVQAALSAAIDELAPQHRAVVVLRDVEGLTHDETATTLGITVATVKARLHRARLFLRKRLGIVMTSL